MLKFPFNQDKALAVLLYLAKKLKEDDSPHSQADIHKISKILYFADQKHMKRYGRPIVGDEYIAMENGPVPSKIYDIIKMVRGDSLWKDEYEFGKFFRIINRYIVNPLRDPEMDEFSESDLECLDESFEENKNLTFGELKSKSHDMAYNRARRDDTISFDNIARVAGVDDSTLDYMKTYAENSALFK